MKKYWAIFKISLIDELELRLDFWLRRLRNIMLLLLLYFLWTRVSGTGGSFAGFTRDQLIMYVLGTHLLRSVVFASHRRRIAEEINEGAIAQFLIKPMNHFWFCYARDLAERFVWGLAALIEMIIVGTLVGASWLLPTGFGWWCAVVTSVFLAHFLYIILSYVVSLLAFWTRQALGPRYLFEWFLEFASGSYFPLSVLPPLARLSLTALPFMYLVYVPLSLYLGLIPGAAIVQTLLWQTAWVAVSAWLAYVVWQKGVRRFTGEGM